MENSSPRATGSCDFFDLTPLLGYADQLVAADEPLMALMILDKVPAFYRDNPPPELLKVKAEIHQLLATPYFYMSNIHDMSIPTGEQASQCMKGLSRFNKIEEDIKAYNLEGKCPHIIDLGPGEYTLPIGLSYNGHQFTYEDIGLCDVAKNKAHTILEPHLKKVSDPITDRPVILVACEIIEHLHQESDIVTECLRANGGYWPDLVHASTPYATWDGRIERLEWRKYGVLGHLRTYTADEFGTTMTEMFPRMYEWVLTTDQPMHIRGVKKKMS